ALGDDVWKQAALFDFIANNADRKAGHCLVDLGGAAFFVDHGLTFHTDVKLRTVIWDFAGEPLPDPMRPDLDRALGGLAPVEELLTRSELRALARRLESALGRDWRFPSPSSSWSVPWPPV